jgi:hypothetical protein
MREVHTVSQDISSNGIYFLLTEAIKDGASVEIEMTLPSKITQGKPVSVRCLGHVQRCEVKEGAKTGVAAAIGKFEFRPSSGKIPVQEAPMRTPPRKSR